MSKSHELHVVVGTGPLGLAVMEELLHRGHVVRMVNRSGQATVPDGVQVVKGDATNAVSISQACRGASVIYHCAKAPYTEWPEKFPPIMEGIIGAAAAEQAKLVYGDNLYMYGVKREPLTENLPNAATGRKGRTRAQMSDRLMAAHREGVVRAVIGRGSDFYGPGVLDSALGERVFRAALEGKPAEVLGDIDTPHTYIYIRDFARGLVTLGEREEALGQIWHVPSAEVITTRELITMAYKSADQQPKFRVAPKAFVSMMSLFNANMRELKEMLYLYEHPFVVDSSKYERAFGKLTTPHHQAVLETMNWFKLTNVVAGAR
ncbi:NAD-dependent epimerase/dehydratase family protein [Paenibacillus sp. F411]|uniref:SDR family oxidoreductase n=1 Tax=Paenibacillus sp. F411 TaxID=2820239 RepID=UPI001AAF5FF6|nr:SDR family oxidoreductase [Paenibacillus sp. F411]MBO2942667.1 NAD-dependent epimerase/dehydratase family protein [Paenibacillus sp. F411]